MTTKMRLWILAASVLILVAGLSLAWSTDLLGVRTASPLATVATDFDPPPSYPGYHWTRNGREVSAFELETSAGPAHCGWQSTTFLTIAWPPGRVSETAQHARQYIRDPSGVLGHRSRDLLDIHATLPKDAAPTGYRYGPLEIYLSPSDEDRAIYVVDHRGAERWPRSDPTDPVSCI